MTTPSFNVADSARDAVFAPIGGEGLTEQTVRRLGEAIGLGLLQEGDQLPPEAELSERFGISLMTLRQALAILREMGYLQTRRGRHGGTVVKRTTPFPPGPEAQELAREVDAESLRDLTDFRIATSGYAARLAARRRTEEEAAQLSGLVRSMSEVASLARFRPLDSRFHVGVAAAAKSRRLVIAETQIQRELGPVLALVSDEPPSSALRRSNDDHQQIVNAIGAGDEARAQTAMEAHINGTLQLIVGLRLGRIG